MGGFIRLGGAIGGNSPLRRRRRIRGATRSATDLKVADEKRREEVINALNQVLAEAGHPGEDVVTIVSCNEIRERVWRYGQFIAPQFISGQLCLGAQFAIGQGAWREISPIREGYLVPIKEFEPNQGGWVFLIGIKIASMDEVAIPVSFNKPI